MALIYGFNAMISSCYLLDSGGSIRHASLHAKSQRKTPSPRSGEALRSVYSRCVGIAYVPFIKDRITGSASSNGESGRLRSDSDSAELRYVSPSALTDPAPPPTLIGLGESTCRTPLPLVCSSSRRWWLRARTDCLALASV